MNMRRGPFQESCNLVAPVIGCNPTTWPAPCTNPKRSFQRGSKNGLFCGWEQYLLTWEFASSCINLNNKRHISQEQALRLEQVQLESLPRGDLLRSVPHIKFGDKIKSHRYLDHSGWLGLIYCSNYRDHWRLLLFELEKIFLWLLKSVCNTVTLRFLHALGPIKAIYLLRVSVFIVLS